jgi:hypothetical protein
MVDNRSGNTTPETATQAYCHLFPEMQTPYNNVLCACDSAVKGESASALWVCKWPVIQNSIKIPQVKGSFLWITSIPIIP